MRRIVQVIAAATFIIGAGRADAQTNETPVRIVLPYPAGGVGDAAARMIADAMRGRLGRPVIVENKAGAAGRLGVQAVKEATPDGSVLLFTPIAPMAIFPHVYTNLTYDPARDFAAVAQIATFDLCIAVGANVPATNLRELVAWLKANPDQAAYGTPAAGSLPHFFALLFSRRAAVDLRHVVYKGNPQAVTDLMGGHLPVFFTSTQDLVEAHHGGRVRVLATSGKRRSAALPEVPTFAEGGYDIQGEGWYGIYAPAGTPADVITKYNRAIVEVVRSAAFSQRMIGLGVQPTGTSSQELSTILQSDLDFWGPIIRASGFSPE